MTIPVEFSAADIRVEMAPPFNVDVSVNGPPGPRGEPGQDGVDGTSGSSGFIAQPEPPADTSVLWLDTDEDPSGSGFLPAGGTDGQVLTKATASDFDVVWETPAPEGGGGGSSTYSLFTGSTPPAAASTDNPAVNVAVEFYVTAAMLLTQIKFWQASSGTNALTRKFGLWDLTTGAFVANGPDVTPALNAGAWITSTLVTPYLLVPYRRYRAIVFHPAGRYSATGGYFSSGAGAAGVTSGVLSAPNAAGATVGNGTFAYAGTLSNTSESFGGGNYWVDVTVETAPSVAGHLIQDEGTPLTQRAAVNFVGAGVTASDDSVNDRTTITIPGGSGGSTILSGTATPGDATGAVGDYYLDSDDRVLYGPKVAGGYLPSQTLFAAQTTYQASGGGAALTFGQDITCARAGRIVGVRYYRRTETAAGITSSTLKIWNSGGTLLGTATTSGESGEGWKTATLGTPLTVTAGQTIRAGVDSVVNQYVGRSQNLLPLTSADLSNGAGTAYYAFPLGYPNTVEAGWTYFVDIVYEADAPPWPVALKSVPPGGTTGQVLGKTTATDYDAAWAAGGGGGSAADSDQNILANQVFG